MSELKQTSSWAKVDDDTTNTMRVQTYNVVDFRDADKVQTITAPQWDIFSIF